MPAIDAEGLREIAGTAAEATSVIDASPFTHALEPRDRLKRPDQHRATGPRGTADEIQAPMDAVRSINIRIARRAEHRPVAIILAAEAVRRGIIVAIRLGLDDAPAAPVHEEGCADQLSCHVARVAGEEGGGC